MRQIITTLVCSVLLIGYSQSTMAQAPDCFSSGLSPFCSGIAQYPANNDGTGAGSGPQAPTGPNYDCLGTQGNPSYFSITINQAGSIDFLLDNGDPVTGVPVDIDFILWGPFNGINAAQLACDSMGTGGVWGDVADCSYAGGTAPEQVSVANTLSGEVYILMVTNYANTPTNIFSTPNSGTGSIACPCDIPFVADTLAASFGNQGFLTDTINGINQFVVCPNNTLGFRVSAVGNLNDTLSVYGPFTSVNNVFPGNNSIFPINPGGRTDTLDILSLVTPDSTHIGVNNFTIGIRNKINTNGFSDSSCFDQTPIQVVVPGIRVNDQNVCSGQSVEITTDSIPTTTLGSSAYAWTQISGPAVTITGANTGNPTIDIPVYASTTSNDSILIQVDYNYGGLCPVTDTMVLRFDDINITLDATLDTVCAGQTTVLSAVLSDTLTTPVCDDYTVTNIPFAPLTGSGNSLALGDDDLSAALPIGFSFDFYCNTYTQFIIASNGFITFDLNIPPFGTIGPQQVPDNFDPNNLIAVAWEDLDPDGAGTIEYFTVGTAPNRILVVNYINVPHWPGPGPNDDVTAQVLIYETTNVIEIHTTSQPANTSHTQGIENADGTVGVAVPGRNDQVWTATNSAYRFEPVQVGPFYSWTPAAGLSSPTVFNPTATVNASTTYMATITDGVCAFSDSISITALSTYNAPVVNYDSATLTSVSFSWTNIGLPAGGFYEYSIDGGVTWTSVGTDTSATITGLASNSTYTILVRGDDNTGGGCSISPTSSPVNATTLSPDCQVNPPVNVSLTATDVLCNGDSTGCVQAIVTGGSGNPMNLAWSNGAMDMDTICNLPAGSYTLVATDTFSTTGGGGTPMMIYQEDFDGGPGGWTLTNQTGANAADANFWAVNSDEAGNPVGSCGTAGGPNQTLHITSTSGLVTGAAYNVGGLCNPLFPILCVETNVRAESPVFSTVGQSNINFDFNYIANGDGLIDNASVFYNAGAGWVLLTNSIKSPVCVSGQGEWSKYTVVLPAICDNNPTVQVGINWTNNDDGTGTDPSVAIDSVSIYSMGASSNLVFCVDSATILVGEPTAIVTTIDSFSNPNCSGSGDGTISVTATGGTPAYTYDWSDGSTNEDATGLNNGTYTLVVTDANSCTDTVQQTLTVPNPILITIDSTTDNTCGGFADGAVAISASGGVGTLSYEWSNGATTEDLTAVADGNYIVTVTDANGCSDTAQAVVDINNSLVITIDAITNNSCAGNADGAIDLSVTGNIGALSYQWSNGATTEDLTAVVEGNYIVTVTDANGCSDTAQAALIPTVLLTATDATTDALCAGQTGSSTITITGGTGTYTFDWGTSSTSTTNTATLAGGLHIVTATDNGNGCTVVDTVTVAVPTAISLTKNINDVSCAAGAGGADGSIDITVSGGTPAYGFSWSNGATSEDLTALTAGNYIITVTDANGCTATDTSIVQGVIPVVVTIDTIVGMLICDLSPIGSLEAQATGGTGFTYSWSNGATTDSIFGLNAGTYTVVVTNANGCSDSATATITAATIPTLNAYVSVTGVTNDTIQPGDNITIYAGGGTGQSYAWVGSGAGNPNIATPTAENSVVTPDAQGTYTYIVTSDVTTNGTTCSVMDTVFVTVEPAYIGMPDAFTPNGDGLNDLFRPITLQTDDIIQFRIYNRFGQLVYNGDDLDNNGWDGTLNGVAQPRDVYIYVLEYKRATDRIEQVVRGEVILLR